MPWPIFNKSKNSAVLEPRTVHFRGLAGFEAKGLFFEAKGFNCVLKDVLEAKDVFEDFTFANYYMHGKALKTSEWQIFIVHTILISVNSIGVARRGRPSSHWNVTNDKNVTKNQLVFSFSFFKLSQVRF